MVGKCLPGLFNREDDSSQPLHGDGFADFGSFYHVIQNCHNVLLASSAASQWPSNGSWWIAIAVLAEKKSAIRSLRRRQTVSFLGKMGRLPGHHLP